MEQLGDFGKGDCKTGDFLQAIYGDFCLHTEMLQVSIVDTTHRHILVFSVSIITLCAGSLTVPASSEPPGDRHRPNMATNTKLVLP